MDERHDMVLQCALVDLEGEETDYIHVEFPGLGGLTITYESQVDTFSGAVWVERQPVLQVDFPTKAIRIINKNGNDMGITA